MVDVIVTDGFTGNVALKTAEGTAKLYAELLRRTFSSSILAKIGYLLARNAFTKLRKRMDPRRYNGAMFLGLQGVCVKSHGGTDADGFANAVCVAVDMVTRGFNETIKVEVARINSAIAAASAAPEAHSRSPSQTRGGGRYEWFDVPGSQAAVRICRRTL